MSQVESVGSQAIVEVTTNLSTQETVMDIMNSDATTSTMGFLLGFLYVFKFNKKTLESPLSSLFDASLNGFLTSIAAAFVSGWLPTKMKFILPVTAIFSCVYYIRNGMIQRKSDGSDK
jgi:hypothetical protein